MVIMSPKIDTGEGVSALKNMRVGDERFIPASHAYRTSRGDFSRSRIYIDLNAPCCPGNEHVNKIRVKRISGKENGYQINIRHDELRNMLKGDIVDDACVILNRDFVNPESIIF